MSILSDRDIVERLRGKVGRDKQIVINPCQYLRAVQPCSVDLHLGNELKKTDGTIIDITDEDYYLKQNEFVLGATLEYVEIPLDLCARVEGRSSIGRLGVTAHITAGFIDTGFKGNITLEITNMDENPVMLRSGMDFCQIVFETLSSPCSRPYGHENLDSKYQGSDGVVLSKYEYNEKET